jgi:hypothetical protein
MTTGVYIGTAVHLLGSGVLGRVLFKVRLMNDG